MYYNNNFELYKKLQILSSIISFSKRARTLAFLCFILITIPIPFVYSQNISKIRIDPNTSRGGSSSDFFQKIDYIPLETNKESLFGEASELVITEKSYVVYDFDTKSVLFFDLSGKFLRKKVFNKDASVGISYMRHSKTVVVVLCPLGKKKYTAVCLSDLGEEKNSIPVSNIKELENGDKLVSLKDGFYAIGGNCFLPSMAKPSSDTTYLINIYNNNKLFKHFIPVTQTSNTAICMLRSYVSIGNPDSNGTAYTSIPLNHIVYKISKDTAQPSFQFVFPTTRILANSILDNKNPKQIDSVKGILQSDQNIILSVSNIFYHKTKLFFKLNPRVYISHAGSSSKNQYNFIYDTTDGNLYALERIMSDKMSYYLPLFDQSVKVSGLQYFNGNLFTTLSSLSMFTEKQKNASIEDVMYPPILQEYFRTQNRKSNPVIIRMKLRE